MNDPDDKAPDDEHVEKVGAEDTVDTTGELHEEKAPALVYTCPACGCVQPLVRENVTEVN